MFYIKATTDGVIEGHPLLADNLKTILGVSFLTDETAQAQGYLRFEPAVIPDGRLVESDNGYKLREDGVVTNDLTLKPFTAEDRVNIWVRPQRDAYLARCDWTQAADSPLSDTKKAEWATYRQELRDITDVYPDVENPLDVIWPTPPTK